MYRHVWLDPHPVVTSAPAFACLSMSRRKRFKSFDLFYLGKKKTLFEASKSKRVFF